MNTPAISEVPRRAAIPAAFPDRAPARQPGFAPDGAALRPARRPACAAARPSAPSRSPAWEILAGALLVVAWALLWSFFLTGVVEPGAALERSARAARAVSLQPGDR